jgi:hypothetical protein
MLWAITVMPYARSKSVGPHVRQARYAASQRSCGTGAASGRGALGGVDTAAAAAQDASSSRMDTPAATRGASSRSEAGMDASWGRGGKRG